MGKEGELVTPGEILGKGSDAVAGKGCYLSPHNNTIYASLTGRVTTSPHHDDSRCVLHVVSDKSCGVVPEPGSIVLARITKVMARTASADIMCVGPKSVKEKFTGIIRQQDVRSTEIDKVDMHLSFRPGDVVRAIVLKMVGSVKDVILGVGSLQILVSTFKTLSDLVVSLSDVRSLPNVNCTSKRKTLRLNLLKLSLGDARAYYLSTAKNELGVVSAESIAGATMVPINWTEMQCPLTGQIEQRKVAKVT